MNLIPTVEIRIPMSGNDKYFRMLRYFLESLQVFGGPIGRSAKCVVSIGRDEELRNIVEDYPWVSNYNVEFLWVDQDLFDEHSLYGTVAHRFFIPSEADIIIMADADLLVTGDFDQAILDSLNREVLLGFIAHASPFYTPELAVFSSKVWWNKLFDAARVNFLECNKLHTAWSILSNDINQKYCPYYFNYGFIVAPRVYIEMIGKTFLDDLSVIDSVVTTRFRAQIAHTIGIARYEIPCDALTADYNFPLHIPDTEFLQLNLGPNGLVTTNEIKVFHYLGDGLFNKEDFISESTLEKALCQQDLNKSAIHFRDNLKLIRDRLEPEER